MKPLLHCLYSPLFWLLFISLAIWIYALLRSKSFGGHVRHKFLAVLYLVGWLLAYLVSTSFGSAFLHRTLLTPAEPDPEFAPEYILVAAMGYVTTGDPESDVLNDGTSSRVATAARWHAKFPKAKVVMQGASGKGDPLQDHQGQLMKQFAMSLGVPEKRILIEPMSTNTREHVTQILEFDDIDPDTPIGVVSSDWHLRRVRSVFRKQFKNIEFMGAPVRIPPVEGVAKWIPRERELLASSLYLREWVAVVWYAVDAGPKE